MPNFNQFKNQDLRKILQAPEIKNVLISAFIVISVIVYLYLFKFSGNITGFFRIGSVLPLSPFLTPDQTFIFKDELGYDGQQFLSLALDPFFRDLDTLESLDHPAYRYRRILYPLLSYLLGFGNPILIPYVMVAINAIAIILIVWLATLYFKSQDFNINQALFTLCIPGIWIVLSLSTSDLVTGLFFVAAFYFYTQNKPIYTSLMVSLACLTRETMLLLWLALVFTVIFRKKYDYLRFLVLAIVPPLIWNFYVLSLNLLGSPGTGNFGFPFWGIIQKIIGLITGGLSGNKLFEAYLFILLILAFVLTLGLSYRNRSQTSLLLVSGLMYFGMFVMTSLYILNYYLDYSRVFIDIYFLALLSLNISQFPYKTIFFSASGLASLAFLALHS
ncbi:MAG: hypothetical protein VKJ02_04705 [Snowella sp.]|nr:hypothetical protein [Snowella sp.]